MRVATTNSYARSRRLHNGPAHHHAMLQTACNWALEEELLLVNPARVKNTPALCPKAEGVDLPVLGAEAEAEGVGCLPHSLGLDRLSVVAPLRPRTSRMSA